MNFLNFVLMEDIRKSLIFLQDFCEYRVGCKFANLSLKILVMGFMLI